MNTLRAPGLVALLACACSLLAPEEDFFSGGSGAGGLANAGGLSGAGRGGSGGSDANGGMGGATSAGAPADAGAAGTSGAATGGGSGGTSGATSGGRSSAGEAGADAGTGATSGGAGGAGGADAAGGTGGTAGTGTGGTGTGGSGGTGGTGTGGSSCTLAPTKTETGKCGACNTGTQTRTLTLTADCTYTAGAWSPCAGVTAACTPGATTACTNGDSCGQRRCTDSCTWSACAPKVAGGCLRIREGNTNEGSNYRCCGASRWQFCLPSCQWSSSCAACSQGAPDYCSDC